MRGRPVLLAACLLCFVPVVLFADLLLSPCGHTPWDLGRRFDLMSQRDAAAYLKPISNDRMPRPRCVADLFYEGALSTHFLEHESDLDYTAFRFGAFTLSELGSSRLSREELGAEIARVYPSAPAWDSLGPVTMCFDPRAFGPKPGYWVILGSLKNYPGHDRGNRELWVVFADGGMLPARALPMVHVDVMAKSLAYYEGLGIPMPEKMVKDLREAMGVE